MAVPTTMATSTSAAAPAPTGGVQTCGYLPSLSQAFTCPDADHFCAINTQISVLQCIRSGATAVVTTSGTHAIAPFQVGCLNYHSSLYGCDSACQAFAYRLTCGNSATPYCGTYLFPSGISAPGCFTNPFMQVSAVYTTINGVAYGSSNIPTFEQAGNILSVPADAEPTITTTSGVPAATSSSSSFTSTASPASAPTYYTGGDSGFDNPTFVQPALSQGTIAGIAVGSSIGGIIVLSLLAWLIWHWIKSWIRANGYAPPDIEKPIDRVPDNAAAASFYGKKNTSTQGEDFATFPVHQQVELDAADTQRPVNTAEAPDDAFSPTSRYSRTTERVGAEQTHETQGFYNREREIDAS